MKVTGMVRRVEAVGQDSPATTVVYYVEYETDTTDGTVRTQRQQTAIHGDPSLYNAGDAVSLTLTKITTA